MKKNKKKFKFNYPFSPLPPPFPSCDWHCHSSSSNCSSQGFGSSKTRKICSINEKIIERNGLGVSVLCVDSKNLLSRRFYCNCQSCI